MRQAIEAFLDEGLPEVYDESLFSTKCEGIFTHVFDSYGGGGQSLYWARA